MKIGAFLSNVENRWFEKCSGDEVKFRGIIIWSEQNAAEPQREIISGSAVKADNHFWPQVDWSGLLSELQTSLQETFSTFTSDCNNNCKHLKCLNFQQLVEVLFRRCSINVWILISSPCASKASNRWLSDWMSDFTGSVKAPAPVSRACPTIHCHEPQQMSQVGCKMHWGLKKKGGKHEELWREGRAKRLPGQTGMFTVSAAFFFFFRAHQVTATCCIVVSRWRRGRAKTRPAGERGGLA